jgi:putative nucleotidyltransferase with HDIG domain
MPEGYRVPTIPAVHARAMAVLNEPDLSMRELASIVEMDPGLTAAVLRGANSAASSPSRRIGTAEEGVVRIGLNATRRIMLTAVIGESFRGFDRAGLNGNELWRHVLACALIADSMTSQGGARSTAFTAGLLHDLGRMAMAQSDPIRYSRIVRQARSGADACEAESQMFGKDHAEWGAEVAEVWSLPTEVIVAIGDHHKGTASYLARAISDSRRIARELRIGDGILDPLPAPEEGGEQPQFSDADRALIDHMGGVDKVNAQIEWYIESMMGTARAA